MGFVRCTPENSQQRGCGNLSTISPAFCGSAILSESSYSETVFLDRKRSLLTHWSLNSNPVSYQLGDLRPVLSPNWPSLSMPGKWAHLPLHRWCDWRRNWRRNLEAGVSQQPGSKTHRDSKVGYRVWSQPPWLGGLGQDTGPLCSLLAPCV
jgi:hypothetical protein